MLVKMRGVFTVSNLGKKGVELGDGHQMVEKLFHGEADVYDGKYWSMSTRLFKDTALCLREFASKSNVLSPSSLTLTAT